MIKIVDELTAHDFLVTKLLEKIGCATFIEIPENLKPDQLGALKNACVVPGLQAVVQGNVLCLSMANPPKKAPTPW